MMSTFKRLGGNAGLILGKIQQSVEPVIQNNTFDAELQHGGLVI